MTRIKSSPVPLAAKRPAGRVKAPQSGPRRRASTNYRTRKQTISPRLIFIAKYNFNHERIKLANDPGVYLMRPQTLYHQLLMFTRSERSSWSLTSGPNGRFEPPPPRKWQITHTTSPRDFPNATLHKHLINVITVFWGYWMGERSERYPLTWG